MKEVPWNDRFNIGVESIDKAHQKLFQIVNKVTALNGDLEKQEYACRETIKYFKGYALKHFADEEEYMVLFGLGCFELSKGVCGEIVKHS